MTLAFKDGTDLTNRLVHGPQVDEAVADEVFATWDPEAEGDVYWLLNDNQQTIRDVASYNAGLDETTVVNHRQFDGFGGLAAETNDALGTLDLAYTGRWRDEATGLQWNLNRWYDPAVGRWISEDPIGFAAGDASLDRYIENGPTNGIDPSGLGPPGPHPGQDMTPNWKQGSGELRHSKHTLVLEIPVNARQAAATVEAKILSDLATFKHFNGNNNDVAIVKIFAVDQEHDAAFFQTTRSLFGFGSDLINDVNVGVSLSVDAQKKEVCGQTLGDHQLVGVRHWNVGAAGAPGGGLLVTITTEAYERSRSGLNHLGASMMGDVKQDAIWNQYLDNMADAYKVEFGANKVSLTNTRQKFGVNTPNPWQPNNQNQPPSTNQPVVQPVVPSGGRNVHPVTKAPFPDGPRGNINPRTGAPLAPIRER